MSTDVEASAGAGLRDSYLPASFGQQRLWFLSELDPQAHLAYNMLGGVHIEGPLDTARLERAIATVVARHEALRTSFRHNGEDLFQVVHPVGQFNLARVSCAEGRIGAAGSIDAWLATEAQTPFDLSQGPLIRATLLDGPTRGGPARRTLVLTMHHAICDGWSLRILLGEIAACYQAHGTGGPPDLPPLTVQYADFASWQRARVASGALDDQRAYWRCQLTGLGPLDLPTDRPSPTMQTFRGGYADFRLDLPVAEFAQSQGATPFMAVLAVLSALLNRLTGASDIAVGTPIAGRQHPDVANVVGFFVNTLVLRIDHSGRFSYRELLDRVKSTCLDAYANQDIPFEQLVSDLHPQRDLSANPFFQVMLRMRDARGRPPTLPGLTLTELSVDSATTIFPLDLAVHVEGDGALGGRLVYNTDLFQPETAARFVDQLGTLFSAALAEPDREFGLLDVLSVGQARQLDAFSRAPRRPLPDTSVPALVGDQVARTPGWAAVSHRSGTLTYRQLDDRANRLAHRLISQGVGPDSIVAVCLERGPNLVVAVLAALRAGAAYLPLDPAYPPDRLTYMLADARAACLVTTAGTAELGPPVIAPEEPLDEWPTTQPAVRIEPGSIAYVIYTSGSTGRPKAVMVTHSGLLNVLTSVSRLPGFGAAHTGNVAAITTPCFDIASLELLLPLIQGGCVSVIDHEDVLDPAALVEQLDRREISLLQATPGIWKMLVESGWRPRRPITALSGGEALTPSLAAGIQAIGAHPWNGYGPSETAIYATLYPIDDQAPVPIGRPVDNTRTYVLDPRLRLTPLGMVGELYIGGAGVGRGYLHRPALTAERFLPDPWSDEPGGRMYRTGDLVRWRPSAQLEYLGRSDHQIKLRGYRIELGEVETVLLRHPQVRDAVVVAREDTAGERRLAAYLTGAAEPDSVVEYLRRHLPEYMIPSSFTLLDTLPHTPNGKVDRAALPAPRTSVGAPYVAPRTQLESDLAQHWRELLGLDRSVGVHDNFFELGGHSLLAARAIVRLRAMLDVEVPLRLIFEYPTIAQLSQRALQVRDEASPAIVRQPRRRGLPGALA